MTIAACYLSMEGVVFGADSTTTIPVWGPDGNADEHYFDYGQKVYEVGRDSQLGVVIWGQGSFLQVASYRTLIAEVGDDLGKFKSVQEVAIALGNRVWTATEKAFDIVIPRVKHLASLPQRSPEEEAELQQSAHRGGGFCVGGCISGDRTPSAHVVTFDFLSGVAQPSPLSVGQPGFWGAPNVINRMLYGIDGMLFDEILTSGKWTGTPDDLISLVRNRAFRLPGDLPLREAVDWVYSSVFSTIKAFKFSHLDPICGGPVEIAIISTDKPFRWVRHKNFDAAI